MSPTPTTQPPPKMVVPAAERCRLSVVESVYHQHRDGRTTSAQARHGRILTSVEHPLVRRVVAGGEWEPLDVSWLKGGCSLLHLTNEEGRFLPEHLTPEQAAALERRIVELGIPSFADGVVQYLPFARIHPRESARFTPIPGQCCSLRCLEGEAAVEMVAFPG